MALVVGQRVRVLPDSADATARRALVLSLDGPDKLEIEFEGSGNEEAVVPAARCRALLPFEEQSASSPPVSAPDLEFRLEISFSASLLGRFYEMSTPSSTPKASSPLSRGTGRARPL